jgi:hypothetical protein
MGLMDLFKSKSGVQAPDSKLRWFGKLPTYADYYSSKGNEDWAVEFNDWLLKGFEVYHARFTGGSRSERQLPICGCAVRLPKSQMTVLATVQDYGGDMRGRPFPISFYAAVPTRSWPGPTSDSLVEVSRVVGDLMALKHEVIRFFKAPGPFDARFGDRDVDLAGVDGDMPDGRWRDDARRWEMADWFERARPGLKIDDLTMWYRLVHKWGENIRQHDARDFEPTFRFPLAQSLSAQVQSSGWLRWLENRMNLSKRNLSLIISGDVDEGPATLSIIVRELMADDFVLLTRSGGDLSFVEDLVSIKAPQEGAIVPDVPAEPPRTWADFADSGAT